MRSDPEIISLTKSTFMKQNLLLTMICMSCAWTSFGQTLSLPPSGDNQKCEVTQYIGAIAHVTVRYSSPDVNGRTGHIWGELVPYGLTDLGFGLRNPAPWRAGANENTTISFSNDVLIEGKLLQAGTYGLFLMIQESGPWTWIFSHNSTAWGSFFYNDAEDALRVEVTPETSEYHEWLTYEFIDRSPTKAELALMWENKRIPMHIELPAPNELYLTTMAKELQGSAGFNYQNWAAAAGFLAKQNYRLDQALEWADASISSPFIGVKSWMTLQAKASVLLQMGKENEAWETIAMGINDPDTQASQVHQYGRQLIADGHVQMALDVFKANYDKFKGAWPTNVGMARGLSAAGKYDEALKYAKLALEEAPDAINKDNLTKAVEKLQQNEDIN